LRCILASPHESSIVAERSLLVGGLCFHKAVAVNGWQGMISHDVEIGCPHCGTLVVHILFDCLFAQTDLEVCRFTIIIPISEGGPNF
jgi:hypothetical protein